MKLCTVSRIVFDKTDFWTDWTYFMNVNPWTSTWCVLSFVFWRTALTMRFRISFQIQNDYFYFQFCTIWLGLPNRPVQEYWNRSIFLFTTLRNEFTFKKLWIRWEHGEYWMVLTYIWKMGIFLHSSTFFFEPPLLNFSSICPFIKLFKLIYKGQSRSKFLIFINFFKATLGVANMIS